MSKPNWPPSPNRKRKSVSSQNPITTAAGPSSSSSAMTGVYRVVPTRNQPQAAIRRGATSAAHTGPEQLTDLSIYRTVSPVYPGPQSALRAGFQAAPAPMTFAELINQADTLTLANVRGQPLLQPEHIRRFHDNVGHAAPTSTYNPVNSSTNTASAGSPPWITDVNSQLPLGSAASTTFDRDFPYEDFSLRSPSNRDSYALDREESRYETNEDTQDLGQYGAPDSDSMFDRPLRTINETVANSSTPCADTLDELRYLMYGRRASVGNGNHPQSFGPAVPSITRSFAPAPPYNTAAFAPSLTSINQTYGPDSVANRMSASSYGYASYPVGAYIAAGASSSAGPSSVPSNPYVIAGSFAPTSAAPDPYARTSGRLRLSLAAENYASTGSSARPSRHLMPGFTDFQNPAGAVFGPLPSADQNYRGDSYSERNASGVRNVSHEEHLGLPGRTHPQQNSSYYTPYQQYSGHQMQPMGYGRGSAQPIGHSGVQEASGPMHTQQEQGYRYRQGLRYREPSRNRQVFQQPRTPYTPVPPPANHFLFEDPPGTVIPDNQGLNPYELRDREAAAEALHRLNSEDEDEVDLTLERLHSRRRRIQNEAQALRLQREEDRVWRLLNQKEAKKSHRN